MARIAADLGIDAINYRRFALQQLEESFADKRSMPVTSRFSFAERACVSKSGISR
jgi:hypothetical protein